MIGDTTTVTLTKDDRKTGIVEFMVETERGKPEIKSCSIKEQSGCIRLMDRVKIIIPRFQRHPMLTLNIDAPRHIPIDRKENAAEHRAKRALEQNP